MGNEYSQQILNRESAVAHQNSSGNFHPDIIKEHKIELEKNGFSFNEQNIATFPKGWKIIHNEIDPRHMECFNDKGKVVFTMFVKDSGYDNYAYLSWCKEDEKPE
jgi:hypothetical protein